MSRLITSVRSQKRKFPLLYIACSCHHCLFFFLPHWRLNTYLYLTTGFKETVFDRSHFIDYNQTFYSTQCTHQVLFVICWAGICKTHCQSLGKRLASSDWGGCLTGQYQACHGADLRQPLDRVGPHPVLKSLLSSEQVVTSLCH